MTSGLGGERWTAVARHRAVDDQGRHGPDRGDPGAARAVPIGDEGDRGGRESPRGGWAAGSGSSADRPRCWNVHTISELRTMTAAPTSIAVPNACENAAFPCSTRSWAVAGSLERSAAWNVATIELCAASRVPGGREASRWAMSPW